MLLLRHLRAQGWYWNGAILAAIAFLLWFSLTRLTTQPRIWVDESLNIDIAHNIAELGIGNVATAPGEFAPKAYMVATTGYAVNAPLAVFFKIFGFGPTQARLYMIVWMLFFAATVVFVGEDIFGRGAGVAALVLSLSFATFYDIGRAVVGELPGFVMLLWGVWALTRGNVVGGGLLWGLAVSTKPSLYLPLGIIFLIHLWRERSQLKWKQVVMGFCWFIFPIIVWVLAFFPQPFAVSTWIEAADFFLDPFGRLVSENIQKNIPLLFSSTTILYFALLAAGILASFVVARVHWARDERRVAALLLLQALFSFIYFMRSPGWLRYLFPAELILLFLFYPACRHLMACISARDHVRTSIPVLAVIFLVIAQIIQLFYFSRILKSDIPETASSYLNRGLQPDETAGIINQPYVAVFIPREQRRQQFYLTGMPLIGEHPLSLPVEKLPQFISFREQDYEKYVKPYEDVLQRHYELRERFRGGNVIYGNKNLEWSIRGRSLSQEDLSAPRVRGKQARRETIVKIVRTTGNSLVGGSAFVVSRHGHSMPKPLALRAYKCTRPIYTSVCL